MNKLGLFRSGICQGTATLIKSTCSSEPKSFDLATLSYPCNEKAPTSLLLRGGGGNGIKSDSELFSQNWAKDSLLSKLRRSQSNCCSQSANIIKGLCQEYIFPEGPTCPLSTLNLYVSDCYYVSNMAKTLLWSKPQHSRSHIHRVYLTSTASYSTKDKLTTRLLPSTRNSNYKTLPTMI